MGSRKSTDPSSPRQAKEWRGRESNPRHHDFQSCLRAGGNRPGYGWQTASPCGFGCPPESSLASSRGPGYPRLRVDSGGFRPGTPGSWPKQQDRLMVSPAAGSTFRHAAHLVQRKGAVAAGPLGACGRPCSCPIRVPCRRHDMTYLGNRSARSSPVQLARGKRPLLESAASDPWRSLPRLEQVADFPALPQHQAPRFGASAHVLRPASGFASRHSGQVAPEVHRPPCLPPSISGHRAALPQTDPRRSSGRIGARSRV